MSAWGASAAPAEELTFPPMSAWYRGGTGFPAPGIMIADWEDQSVGEGNPQQGLQCLKGNPQTLSVETPNGPVRILQLDGTSVLGASAGKWGTLEGDRTVVVLLRLKGESDGFLFDGATHSGMTRARVRQGKWEMGCQPSPLTNAAKKDVVTLPAVPGVWQIHGFVFQPQADGSTALTHWAGANEIATGSCSGSAPLAGLILGADVRQENRLTADIAELQVYPQALSREEFLRVSRNLHSRWGALTELPASEQLASPLRDPQVFRTVVRKQGDEGVHTYRIPGITTTREGTLLSVFDIRHDSTRDLPANIDVGLMRSTDGGTTWERMQTIIDYDKNSPDSAGNGVGDPAILADLETGDVFVAAAWAHGDLGWARSGAGLEAHETAQLVMVRSRDDGKTWSKPVSITKTTKQKAWKIFIQGPGSGIQLRDGTLVFAAQFKDEQNVPHSCLIWSGDHGETWHVTAPAVPEAPPSSESQVAELSDGSLLLTMRNERRSGQRLWARYQWKGSLAEGKWSSPWFDLPDPTCMASLIRHPSGALIFSNPNSSTRRIGLTVRVSDDDGKTWSDGRLIDPRFCSYSCLTVLKNGDLGLLYECGAAHAVEQLAFARFSLDWLRGTNSRPATSLRLSPAFSDQMVLQSGAPIPVWGIASPGQQIEVCFGTQKKQVQSDAQGKWSTTLDPLPVSNSPGTLTVSAAGGQTDSRLVLNDILVGDVWLAAGQSNMDWPVRLTAERQQLLLLAATSEIRLLERKGPGSANIVYSSRMLSKLNPDHYFSGHWTRAAAAEVDQFSAVAWAFASRLQRDLQRPIGIIDVSIGGTPTEAWVPRTALEGSPAVRSLVQGSWLTNPAGDAWCQTRAKVNFSGALANGEPLPGSDIGPYHCYQPGFLWEAGVAPLVPFPIRGILWYQGESNATSPARVQQHADLFPLLVESWRKAWNQPQLPFYYVQLPGIERPDWPEFRDQQRRLLEQIPHSGMVTTMDLGHPTDVHPRRKQPVGERLALLALSRTYGQQQLDSGPLVTAVTKEGQSCRIHFEHAEGLCSSNGEPLTGFELAGDDEIFHPAQAECEGTTLRVFSPAVSDPRSVRYGWLPNPQPPLNLVNRKNLPASPFRLAITP
ncbi:exo-alpha-sialidase [Planctomicrobium sp. SH664]|uniref:exo-alpha-sialidase n=1 Tax=Planctomicrobium sp. SH664 TaxID=3448125 RepID=UPI003F5C8D04